MLIYSFSIGKWINGSPSASPGRFSSESPGRSDHINGTRSTDCSPGRSPKNTWRIFALFLSPAEFWEDPVAFKVVAKISQRESPCFFWEATCYNMLAQGGQLPRLSEASKKEIGPSSPMSWLRSIECPRIPMNSFSSSFSSFRQGSGRCPWFHGKNAI